MKSFKQHGNSFEWVQKFPGAVKKILAGQKLESPLHVEIHPHHKSTVLCNNHCSGCTGLKYTFSDNSDYGIERDRLIQTIDGFAGRVPKVVFSGCCIEPLLYPGFEEILEHSRDAKLEVSLYSNFYYANPNVVRALTNPRKPEYVRVSLNAGTEEAYNKVHRPDDPKAFQVILNNLHNFLSMKKAGNPYFYITYLMTRDNCDKKNLESVMKIASSPGIDMIRFSVYQKPLGRKMPAALNLNERELKDARNMLQAFKSEYETQTFSVQITDEQIIAEQKEKPFDECRVRKVFAVIGFDGSVYPCTAMASPYSPSNFKFGNINTEDFWDIWGRERPKLSLERCLDCTRAEFEINSGFHELKNG